MLKKIVVFSQVNPVILEKLHAQFQVVQINPKLGNVDQQIRDAVADADGMIGAGRLLNENNLNTAKRLKVISSISVGYDNYDLKYLNFKKIWLTHTPDVLTETTADLGFGLMLSAARQIPQLDRWTKMGHWTRTVGAAQFGMDVYGKTLGIIGLGHIGFAIAKRAYHGFNMNVLYYGRSEKEYADSIQAQFCTLQHVLSHADFVVVAVDLNAETKALIGRTELELMKSAAVFVNISRGAVVDEQALVDVLKQRKIFAAGLDVYQKEPLQQSELFELDNVVTLPHIGSATEETRFKMAELAYRNLLQGLNGQLPSNAVNPDH